MTKRLLQLLHRAGWEFWLPLPLIALLFWQIGNLVAVQVLSRSYNSLSKLEADTESEVARSEVIVAINAEIDRNQGTTTVVIRTTDSSLKPLRYEFPITQSNQVEVAIAQELKLPVEAIRKLINYSIRE